MFADTGPAVDVYEWARHLAKRTEQMLREGGFWEIFASSQKEME